MLTLTPQARAIAAFTLAVLLVLGELNKIVLGVVLDFGTSYPDGRGGRFLTALMVIAVAGAITFFATQTSRALEAGAGWETHVARASVLIAAVGLVITAVIAFGSVVSNESGGPGLFGLNFYF